MADTAGTDVIDVLKSQHDEAKAGLSSVVDAASSARGAAFEKLAPVLAAHEHGEESIVYPAIEDIEGAVTVIAARKAEEHAASQKIAELKKLDPSSESFLAGFKELKSAVEAHAGSEEAEVFPLLASLDGNKRSELGAAMAEAVKPA